MIRTVLHIFHGARDHPFYRGIIIQKVPYKIFIKMKSAIRKKKQKLHFYSQTKIAVILISMFSLITKSCKF